ncbi:hypothetical protein [Lentzea jiangxiensis]|uniref:hypothetical protein n=1 Tax=Lentzea jiangxiensis TaxID=641025 RepID=UPI00115FE610|nr:hypothetical protein [Lentzea jiangxiensis]
MRRIRSLAGTASTRAGVSRGERRRTPPAGGAESKKGAQTNLSTYGFDVANLPIFASEIIGGLTDE